jgi:hypothetical protein
MNIKKLGWVARSFQRLGWGNRPQVVAIFGSARLIRQIDGRYDLLGGNAADCADAREWCSLFAPEVVFGPSHVPSTAVLFAC